MDPAGDERPVLSAAMLHGLAKQRAKCQTDLARIDEMISEWKEKATASLKTLKKSAALMAGGEDKGVESQTRKVHVDMKFAELVFEMYEEAATRQLALEERRSKVSDVFKDVQMKETAFKKWKSRCPEVYDTLTGSSLSTLILISTDEMKKLMDANVPPTAKDETRKLVNGISDAGSVFIPVRVLASIVYYHDKQSVEAEGDHQDEILDRQTQGPDQQLANAVLASTHKSIRIADFHVEEDIKTWMNISRMVDNRVTAAAQQDSRQRVSPPDSTNDVSQGLETGGVRGRGRPKNPRLDDAITNTRDELFRLDPTLTDMPEFSSLEKFREQINKGRALRKLFEGYESGGRLNLPIYDLLVSIQFTLDDVSKVPTCFWHILRQCLDNTSVRKDLTDLFTDPKRFITDPSNAPLLEDIRSLTYHPGQQGSWSFGISSTYNIEHLAISDIRGLKVDVKDLTMAATALEQATMVQTGLGLIPRHWRALMGFMCHKIAVDMDVAHDMLPCGWLKTLSSSEVLPPQAKQGNLEAWENGNVVQFAVLMDDTPGQETYALAAFEKGGKADGCGSIHVVNHYDNPKNDWVLLVRKLFPNDYPIHDRDLVFHAKLPGLQKELSSMDSGNRLVATGMFMLIDFIYLVITGNQFEGENIPDHTVMRRVILHSAALSIMKIRQDSRSRHMAHPDQVDN